MRNLAAILLAGVALAGCANQRATHTIEKIQTEMRSTQYDQIREQLAYSYDHPYDIPASVAIGTAEVSAQDSVGLTYGHENVGALAPTSKRTTTFSLGASTLNVKFQASVNPSPVSVAIMRDIYAYAVLGEEVLGEAAWDQLSAQLPYDPPRKRWLYRTTGSMPANCVPSCYLIIKKGKYSLWANTEKDYSDFAISVLIAATLKPSEEKDATAVVVKAPGKKTKVIRPPTIKVVPGLLYDPRLNEN